MINQSNVALGTTYSSKGIKLNYAILFTISLFFLNETVRSVFNEKLGNVNVLFFIFGTMFLLRSLTVKGKIRYFIFYITLSFSAVVLTNTFFLDKNASYYLMIVSNLLLPIFLLCIKVDKEQSLLALRNSLKVFNVFIAILLVLGVIDYLSHSYIQLFLSRTLFNGLEIGTLIQWENITGIYRYYSIFGHPLMNAEYFLIFFIMNNVYAKHDKQLINGYFISFMTILGLVLSGSKTALVLGIVLVAFFSKMKRNKWFYILLLSGAFVIFLNSSLFQDNLKMRYVQGMESGDLTTGRNELLKTLVSTDGERPQFILGGGAGNSREVAKSLNGNITNFEYPSIMLAYDYGILGFLAIYLCVFIFPAIHFIRKKSFYTLFLFLILSLMVNTNNGIANLNSDALSVFCFMTFLLINLDKEPVRIIEKKKRRKRIKITWK